MSNLKEILTFNGEILENEDMSKHTTYNIGGPARYFVRVNDISSLSSLLRACKDNNLRWEIIGGGSNLLVSDEGIDACVIVLDGEFKNLNFDNNSNLCECGAGVSLAKLLNEFKKRYLRGLEFAVGIPGSVGGAVKMNAGRKSQWIASQLDSVTIINDSGKTTELSVSDIEWGYRSSSIKNNEIVTSVKIRYKTLSTENERAKMRSEINALTKLRREIQPTTLPSCGSVFKNPEKTWAGKLIEEAGFKGKKVGGAQVSEKHANFIVNNGGARAEDVLSLINDIQNKVYADTNIKLVPEVRFMGFKKNTSLF